MDSVSCFTTTVGRGGAGTTGTGGAGETTTVAHNGEVILQAQGGDGGVPYGQGARFGSMPHQQYVTEFVNPFMRAGQLPPGFVPQPYQGPKGQGGTPNGINGNLGGLGGWNTGGQNGQKPGGGGGGGTGDIGSRGGDGGVRFEFLSSTGEVLHCHEV